MGATLFLTLVVTSAAYTAPCVNAITIHLCRAACEDGFIGLFCFVIETDVTQGRSRLRIMSEATKKDRKSSICIINYETVLIVIPAIASPLFLTTPAVAISSTPPVSAFLIFVSFGPRMWHKRCVAALKCFCVGNPFMRWLLILHLMRIKR